MSQDLIQLTKADLDALDAAMGATKGAFMHAPAVYGPVDEAEPLNDQAAIFASNNTNAFMLRGAADADSQATNFGDALSAKAADTRLALEAEERKKDDPASDASMIVEAGERIRKELQQISVGGIEMSAQDWDDIRETLRDPAKLEAFKGMLRAEGKSEAEIAQSVHMLEMATSIARKKEMGVPLTDDERQFEAEMGSNPELRQQPQGRRPACPLEAGPCVPLPASRAGCAGGF